MKKTIYILMVTWVWNQFVFNKANAQNNQQNVTFSCSNDECYTAAENLLLVTGLLAATTAPYFLLPKSSHSFLNRSPGHVAMGGFISNTRMARLDVDFNIIPDSLFGLNTSLTLADLKNGYLASLRYEALMEWPIYQNEDSRMSFDFGFNLEKLLEMNEVLAGPTLGIKSQTHLTGKWKLEGIIKNYLIKKNIYRGEMRLIYSSHRGFSSLMGYQLENNRNLNLISQYVFVGIPL